MLKRNLAIISAILLCVFSTGGQQESEKGKQQTPERIPATHKRIPPADQAAKKFTNVRPLAHLPDGRLVVFPPSTSNEEIDMVAKRVAEGAVELPPGARVIGWEPAEGANALLPRYEARFATLPAIKDKLNSLANAAGMLQTQIDFMKSDIKYAYARIATQEKLDDGLAEAIDTNTAALANDVGYLTTRLNQLSNLKRELDEFKDVACPILRRANVDELTRMRLNSSCGSH
jgi:hypothetical protein